MRRLLVNFRTGTIVYNLPLPPRFLLGCERREAANFRPRARKVTTDRSGKAAEESQVKKGSKRNRGRDSLCVPRCSLRLSIEEGERRRELN